MWNIPAGVLEQLEFLSPKKLKFNKGKCYFENPCLLILCEKLFCVLSPWPFSNGWQSWTPSKGTSATSTFRGRKTFKSPQLEEKDESVLLPGCRKKKIPTHTHKTGFPRTLCWWDLTVKDAYSCQRSAWRRHKRQEMPEVTGGNHGLSTVNQMGTAMPTRLLKSKPSISAFLPTHFQNLPC